MIWCFAKNLFMRRDTWAGTLFWWSLQSPVAHSCSLLNHLYSFYRGVFKLNAKFNRFVTLLCNFECGSHLVHVLTQRPLPSPLTSTVKSSLFTPVHSSPLSLAARLHRCHTYHSHDMTMAGLFLGRPCLQSLNIQHY